MGTTAEVKSVGFGVFTDEEVKGNSVVKITNPNLVDILGKPIPGGLYDPAMGPIDNTSLCGSCGQRSYLCNGHCGHIELVSKAYNPLFFDMLSNILNSTCLHCKRFRSRTTEETATSVSQLELIKKGDLAGAKELAVKSNELVSMEDDDSDEPEESEGSHISHPMLLSDGENHVKNEKQACWSSAQLSEAMAIMSEFFKKKSKKCVKCKNRNLKITKPTFGWFRLVENSASETRSDIVRASKFGNGSDTVGDEDNLSSEVVNAGEQMWNNDSETAESNSVIDTSENLNQGSGNYLPGPLLPSKVRDIMRQLWENEAPFCSYISDIQQQRCERSGNESGYSMFFLETILVPPIRFRSPAKGGESVMEHPQTILLGKVLQANIALGNAHVNNVELSKIIHRMMELQQSINVYYDSKNATSLTQKDSVTGICQLLEKKEGIFRQKMMGKRVNFACRSVISPDPYLAVNEIGIPPYFALRLTYPERVTQWNASKLRGAVINGPDIHPGATTYIDSVNTVRLPPSHKMRVAVSRKLPSSRGVVTESGKFGDLEFEGKIVHRHLQDGDIVLVNRQPTLHKPSIMAHVVRVLHGERTLRMHYANCSSYNADFDGDEINVHFPQDEISRAEAYNIVNANEQYIVPTKGDTVRGLIQDHIVGAVLLTMKNTFLTRSEFSQLLYGSGVYASGPGLLPQNHNRKVTLLDSESSVDSVLPAVWKPEPLWTGKQVITALLNHITRGCAPFTIENQGKIPKNYFFGNSYTNGEEDQDQNAEHNLLVWKNELVRGVIDKAQFGKFGLVHTVQELYGATSAGIFLSALSRLFTIFLQFHGFTCGIDDLIILPDYDAQRKDKLEGEDVGEEVHCEFVKFKPGQIGPEELQLEIEKAICSDRESSTASLDMKMKNKLNNKLTREGSQILKHLLTAGLLKPFPKNCISVMTTTGAKGSTVNFQQISAYLGQQELEGKRVPRMVSGKTLPSFPPWDYTSRAGGFITDRFLTGLRPQEYYFHCMAGREGLVDTAVKTSRSGYLQRCLVKNLESLKVTYDHTVRDADGSIVQFYYGEDGIDVHQTSFLKNFKALQDNRETFSQKFQNNREFNGYIKKLPEGLEKEARHFIQEEQNKSSEKQSISAAEVLSSSRKSRTTEKALNKEKEQDKFIELVKQKYLFSLAQPGEPVGVIAAQSVGEPSTQMTLNTFHLAGRGEMNVTLGIPRLQEILMTASEVIKTPLLTCPFSKWRSKHEVVSLVSNVKKVCIADLVENMEVQLSIDHEKEGRVYKLKMKLKDTEFVSLENVHETLKTTFLGELENAIESHVLFLSRVSGIKNLASKSKSTSSIEADEEESGLGAEEANEDGANGDGDGDDDDDDDDKGDDLGSDVLKRKQQATDEMEYEDDVGPTEENDSSAPEKGTNDGEDDESEHLEDDQGEASNGQNDNEATKSKATEFYELSPELSGKKIRRAFYMKVKGTKFEVHFKFQEEPDMLIAQIAQKTAKKVYIKKSGKINQCKMVEYDPDEKTVIWDETKTPKRAGGEKSPEEEEEDTAYWAVKASGVDFRSFWEMHDDLDLNRLYSNNIYAMLVTYGVEAARATIVREVKHVFDIYGVKIDYRHLSLIADYMTHTGEYLPTSRHGCISKSSSPLLKMTNETPNESIKEAGSYGLTDHLETPSSRIIVGLPVKMGTGSFELMQQLNI